MTSAPAGTGRGTREDSTLVARCHRGAAGCGPGGGRASGRDTEGGGGHVMPTEQQRHVGDLGHALRRRAVAKRSARDAAGPVRDFAEGDSLDEPAVPAFGVPERVGCAGGSDRAGTYRGLAEQPCWVSALRRLARGWRDLRQRALGGRVPEAADGSDRRSSGRDDFRPGQHGGPDRAHRAQAASGILQRAGSHRAADALLHRSASWLCEPCRPVEGFVAVPGLLPGARPGLWRGDALPNRQSIRRAALHR